MKKIVLFFRHSDTEKAVRFLREMGTVHIEHLKKPSGDELFRLKNRRERFKKAAGLLKGSGKNTTPKDSPERLLERVETLKLFSEELEQLPGKLSQERLKYAPFGNIDLSAVRKLQEKGLIVRLFRVSAKEKIEPPSSGRHYILGKERGWSYLMFMGLRDFSGSYEEYPLPEKSLSEIDDELKEISEKILIIKKEMVRTGRYRECLQKKSDEILGDLQFTEVKAGRGEGFGVSYLQGFFPAGRADEIRTRLMKQGWGVLITEPSPEDKTPTLLKSPAWASPIHTVMKFMNILPGYMEKDISVQFLLFFTLFSALIVGDAGYGLLFFLTALLLKLVWKKFPKEPFILLVFTSLCTILWGVMTGNYFGIGEIPAFLNMLRIEWLLSEKNSMGLCFFLGATHLTIAHVLNCVSIIKRTEAIAQLGWIGMTWSMYFIARTIILGDTFPGMLYSLFGISVTLIALFSVPLSGLKSRWHETLLLPLDFVRGFVDVVSYIRLFAVGSASVAVALSFNEIAFETAEGSPFSGLFSVLILILGHGLNVVIIGLGILVHGVRLNVLEFSGHAGVQWGGIDYQPFKKLTLGEK